VGIKALYVIYFRLGVLNHFQYLRIQPIDKYASFLHSGWWRERERERKMERGICTLRKNHSLKVHPSTMHKSS
jgi:hypothetical protein